MIPSTFKIGFITFHFYGLIIVLAIYIGWYLAKKRASFYNISQKIFDDPILIIPLVSALLGARLYHVVDYWYVYSQQLISIIYVWEGGLGIWGGIAGAVFGFFLVSNIKKINFLPVLDLVAPSLLLGQAIGRIGNFINQEGFGPPTNLIWGVYINPDRRPDQFANFSRFHPTFFYEAILNAILLVILLVIAKKHRHPGQIFAYYLIFYSVSRFISEFWRIDTWMVGEVKIAHVVATIVFIIGIGILLYSMTSKNSKHLT